VTVNEQVVRLFELKEMTVADAFLSANIRAKQLYGKPGHGIAITVKNQDIFIPGGHGLPAAILVNGENASTKTAISNGDVISLVEGRNGEDAKATIRDIVDEAMVKKVTVQGATYELKPIVKINNKICSLDHELKDRDSLQVETIQTIEEVLKYLKKTELLQKLQSFYVTIDGKPVLFPEFTSKLLLNGKPCKLQYPVNDGDSIAIEKSEGATVEMVANKLNLVLEEKIVVSFQGEVLELTKLCREVVANGEVVPASQSVLNGASLSIVEKDTSPWIYQDVFRFSNWQIPVSFKGKFTILRNGKASSFDEEIFGGDQLEIILTEESVVK